jgi:hypothetical protein
MDGPGVIFDRRAHEKVRIGRESVPAGGDSGVDERVSHGFATEGPEKEYLPQRRRDAEKSKSKVKTGGR